MRKAIFLLAIALLAVTTYAQDTTQGTLYAVSKKGADLGACPLKNTAVKADISGFLARVNVRQEFENTFTEPIEAVYTFPLSQNGAVDDMAMTIGPRVVRGKIMKRDEARQVYETAKANGQTASLLDQERPNIFTQAVANIMPGEKVVIEISYVETLKYEDGAYEFVFPMTVGPRYIPAGVKDANKIKPPISESRPGHDISVEVNLNAGVPIESIRSTSHKIDQLNIATGRAKITLQGAKTIPNKDLILRYDVTGKRLEDGVLAHRDKRGGFFTLVLQPPDTVAPEDRTPKEIVFVLDTSGSMYGFPLEKAKEAMKLSIDNLYPEDTFNLITFAGETEILFDKPVPATQANLTRAQAFLDGRQGGGGTEMMKAIKAALDPSDSQQHLRIVCFMTDAFIGNDDEIIAEIQKHPNARVFSFGIGSSVNRSLLDRMAEAGKGEVEYVGLDDDGSKAAKRFYERVRTPMLTDLSIDWNGMPVTDIYPNNIGDLFSAKPVVVNARYTGGASGTIKLKGKVAGQPYERTINLSLPETEDANDVLATLWARRRVHELSMDALKGGADAEAANKEIEALGLEYRILTQYTSFVAVEEQIVNRNGAPTRVDVPVAIPEGVDRKMATDAAEEIDALVTAPGSTGGGGGGNRLPVAARKVKRGAGGSGSGGGMGRGIGSGMGTGRGTGSNAQASVSSVVNVTASVDEPAPIKTEATSLNATISRRTVESLPKGATFSSLLTMTPSKREEKAFAALTVDGASGSENGFIIDGAEVANYRSGTMNANNSTLLDGRAVAIAEPAYPAQAAAKKALGKVEVEIKVDANGTVTSAKAISGDPFLRTPSEAAAMLSKFAQTFVDGRAVRVSGTLVYDFKSARSVEVFIRDMKVDPPTEEDKKAIRLGAKLHAWVYAAAFKPAGSKPGEHESAFVRDGKASVVLTLTDRSPGTMEKLKALGFEIDPKAARVTGTIAVDKLATLAELDQVLLILPKV